MKTSEDYSPWQLLPAPEPKSESPPFGYFYENVAKHLVKDTVRIMQNGLPIDLEKVQQLEHTIDKVLAQVQQTLEQNPIIKQYQSERYKRLQEEYKQERLSKCRTADYYLKPFKHSDMAHRSYFMSIFAERQEMSQPSELLPTGVPKWTAKQVKVFAKTKPILQRLLDGKLNETNSEMVIEAMQRLAQDKASIHNKKYEEQISTLSTLELPPFNPSSPDQKHDVFTDLLGYESDKLTDAYIDYERKLKTAKKYGNPLPEPPKNKYSWDRTNIENLIPKNDAERDLQQALIDHSMGSIIKNNFIQAFYDYSICDGEGNCRLQGTYRLLGAKSGRFTSSNPLLKFKVSFGRIS